MAYTIVGWLWTRVECKYNGLILNLIHGDKFFKWETSIMTIAWIGFLDLGSKNLDTEENAVFDSCSQENTSAYASIIYEKK